MSTRNILVTGLCFSRNRGGPAMALSFMEQIKRHLSAKFIFAVDAMYLELEKTWASHYGVEVVPRDTILLRLTTDIALLRLGRQLIRRLLGRTTSVTDNTSFWNWVHEKYQEAFDKADCVIDLNGITFVGDGTRSWLDSFVECTPSIYAKKHNNPFFRFIQSYGPFKDWRVRLLAKLDLTRLPCVMARGRLAANYCRTVAGNVPVYTLPDVAIILQPAKETWLRNYLSLFNLQPGGYIVLSPSAVIASMPTKNNSSIGSKHISVFANIASHYLSLGKTILFVPHMTSPIKNHCDRVVCEKVVQILEKDSTNKNCCYIINDELDCREFKALIGNAQLAIVSRYHALVAALSTGVPVVTVGWNDKYQDLLDFYESAEFAVDARIGEPSLVAEMVFKKANIWTNERVITIKNKQTKLENMVNEAGKICADWILGVTK